LAESQTAASISTAQKPSNYIGKWQLSFNSLKVQQPIGMTLTNGSVSIQIPASIPAYGSEINPSPGQPGSFDNRILGQTGNWVWIAMKGPEKPPIPQLVWHYRRWNRILAVNIQTRKMQVFGIPTSTSETDTWGTTPAFTSTPSRVYIGTGNWVGVLPANPSGSVKLPVVKPEPSQLVQQNQQKMLQTLQQLETTAATGLTSFWNNYVMKGNQKYAGVVWIEDPSVINHGNFPLKLYWALNFPLQPGTAAYQQRQKLTSEIEAMLKDPVPSASLVYPAPAKLKAAYHGTPPSPIPGYVIKNGYYVKQK
jgi:hypothetical protein